MKILCAGDSLTFGTGSSTGYSYPDQLNRWLHVAKGKVQVVNDGHPAFSTREYWDYMQSSLAGMGGSPPLLFFPVYDFAILMLGTNDCRRDNWVETPQSIKYLQQITFELGQRVTGSSHILLCSIPPLANPMPRGIVGGQAPWVQSKVEEEMNPALKRLAGEMNLTFVDIHDVFVKACERKEAVYDGLHPNDAGYALIALSVGRAIITVRGLFESDNADG